jgi:acyl carrier protein
MSVEALLAAALTIDGEPLAHRLSADGTSLVVAAEGRLGLLDLRLMADDAVGPENAPAHYAIVAELDAADAERPAGAEPVDIAQAGAERYTFREPASPREVEIARIWAEALGVRRVGADDDFLDLGGDSFTAVAVSNRLDSELGIDVLAADLYHFGTVRRLAAQPGADAEAEHDAQAAR